MDKSIIFLLVLSGKAMGQAQFNSCYLSGDSSGRSTWCGDNVEEDVDITNPQAVMEGAMKFIEKHNKMIWDPLTWTVPPVSPPSLPPGRVSLLPALLPETVTPPTVSRTPAIPAPGPLLPAYPDSDGTAVLLSPLPSPAPADPEASLFPTPSSIPLEIFQTTQLPLLFTLPTLANAEADGERTLPPPILPLPARGPPHPLSSDGALVNAFPKSSHALQGHEQRTHAVLNNKLFLNNPQDIPDNLRGDTRSTDASGVYYQLQELPRLLELSPLPPPSHSLFQNEYASSTTSIDPEERSNAYDAPLLPISHSEQLFDSPIDPVTRQSLKPTRLTLDRSPAAFSTPAELTEIDDQKLKLAKKLNDRSTAIFSNPRVPSMKLTRFSRLNL